MISLTALTANQLAVLLMAVEREHDRIRKSDAYIPELVDVAGELRNALDDEYSARGLNWRMFEKDGE